MNYLKQFEYVIAIANAGSISKAADDLSIAQPTLSKYLSKIEAENGVEFFDRSVSPIKLTKAGEKFIETGYQMIALNKQMKKQLLENDDSLTIDIGISPSRAPYVLPQVLKNFRSNRSNCLVHIKEGNTADLNEALANGQLDMIISLKDDNNKDFECIALFDEKVYLAKNIKDKDKSYDELSLISYQNGRYMHEVVENYFHEKQISIISESISTALALVKNGIGFTVVPSYIAKYSDNDDIYFEEIKSSLERNVCLFYRKQQFLSSSEKQFIECVVNSVKEI